jgi:hypothetical protein
MARCVCVVSREEQQTMKLIWTKRPTIRGTFYDLKGLPSGDSATAFYLPGSKKYKASGNINGRLM